MSSQFCQSKDGRMASPSASTGGTKSNAQSIVTMLMKSVASARCIAEHLRPPKPHVGSSFRLVKDPSSRKKREGSNVSGEGYILVSRLMDLTSVCQRIVKLLVSMAHHKLGYMRVPRGMSMPFQTSSCNTVSAVCRESLILFDKPRQQHEARQ